MFRRFSVGISAMVLIDIVGCATYDSTKREVATVVDQWQRSRAHSVTTRPAAPTAVEDSSSPSGAVQRPPVQRRVDRYILEALSRNPEIQTATAEARAKLERIPQVMSLPDPMIRSVVRPEPIQTAAGDVFLTLGVSQTFPLLAKLERAGNVAAAETRMALERLNGKRMAVIADVERAYWQVYRLDRYLEIARQNRQLLEDLAAVVNTRYQVGQVQQQDVLRVQTETAKLRNDEHRYGLQRASAAAALNRLADQPADRDIPKTTPVNLPAIRADMDRLVGLASAHNPELAALREQISRDREQVELANLGYWPDVSLGFEWNYLEGRDPFVPPVNPMTGKRPPHNRMSDVGDDNWGVMLQMNIPIWTMRIEAAKREARQKLLASMSALRSAENMIAFRIFDAWSRLELQHHTLGVLDTELIPQARQTYEVTLTAYQTGQTPFVTLIDNWRRWLDFELMRHGETVDLETAFAELQREVGLQLLRGDIALDSMTEGASDE